MGSRDKDQTTSHHHPLLSSLVVGPSVSGGADGGGGGEGGRGGGGGGSDYEPGEVRREPPPNSRSDQYKDEPAVNVACKNLGLDEGMLVNLDEEILTSGYKIRAGSSSPIRRRDTDHRHGSIFDRSGGPSRSRDFGNGRGPRRYRDSSPPHIRGPGGGRQYSNRSLDGTGYGPGPFRGEAMPRNNPNVRPREGDWFCPDPLCANLNFARREYCNTCKRPRYAPAGSPHGGYPGPLPSHAPLRRFPVSPVDLSPPRRNMNGGFRSPPRDWAREGPRDFRAAVPPAHRHEGRFFDHSMHRDRPDYLDDNYRGRDRFDRPMPLDWGHRDRGRDNLFNSRKGYERRPPSPPPLLPPQVPPRAKPRDVRERSRSPIRGAPPPKDYRRDMYLERGRENPRGVGRDRMADPF